MLKVPPEYASARFQVQVRALRANYESMFYGFGRGIHRVLTLKVGFGEARFN